MVRPEAARSAWKLGRTLQFEDKDKNEKEIKQLLEKAMRLRHELVPDDKREEPELVDAN